MEAFNGSQDFKDEMIKRAERHQELDEYIRQSYGEFENGVFRGCSVGCSIKDINEIQGSNANANYGDHYFLAEKLGVPLFVTTLQDHFFENVSDELLKSWTVDFFKAIPVGADLTPVLPKFLLFIVSDSLQRVSLQLTQQRDAIQSVIYVLEEWVKTGTVNEAARAAASAAEWSAVAAAAAARAAEAEWAAAAAAAARAAARADASAAAAAAAEWAASAAARAEWAASEEADASASASASNKYAVEFLRLISEC